MISLIVPTRNRAFTLKKVAQSFFKQKKVDEIIFVNDGGSDNTKQIIYKINLKYPQVKVKYIKNKKKLGAAKSRNIGVGKAKNKYILFCDDDMYLEQGYAWKCMKKLLEKKAGAVSGRLIYLRAGESQQAARNRFGLGTRKKNIYSPLLLHYNHNAIFKHDIKTPLSHAVILTRKDLLEKYPFDPFYKNGNGYREESDYQLNLFVNNYFNIVTNDCATFHLPWNEVQKGGQRTKTFERIYWSFINTKYILNKYFKQYAAKTSIRLSQNTLLFLWFLYFINKEIQAIIQKKYFKCRLFGNRNAF